jgi:single-stranded DNA-binding protein
MNTATLTGYITNDPQVKHTTTGKTVINFTLSVYAKFRKDQQTGKKWVSFFNCQYFPSEKPEGNIQKEIANIVKGARVVFDAEPVQERWQDQQSGQNQSMIRWNVEGWVNVLHHINQQNNTQAAPQPQQPGQNQPPPGANVHGQNQQPQSGNSGYGYSGGNEAIPF